jgi:HK97 family phage major capsid protein
VATRITTKDGVRAALLEAKTHLDAGRVDEANSLLEEIETFNRASKGSDLLRQLGNSAPVDGGESTGIEYLDLGSKGHGEALVKAMREQKALGQKALVGSGSVVVGNPLIDQNPVTLGRPLRSFLQAIPSVVRPAVYSWLAQTVRTDNAAVVAAGAVKPTSAFTLVKKPGKLSVIATLSEAIDKFVLEDDTALVGWVGMELTQSVLLALETQILTGDGTDPNLTGLANTSGIQLAVSSAGNTDKLVEMRKALTKLETAGETPAVFILNPNDWEGIASKRNASGEFDTGSAINHETRKAWGVPVAVSTALAANAYYLLGDKAAVIGRDSGGIKTEWATPGDLFTRNQLQARTEGRFGLEVARPMAVVKGTFV